MDGASNRYEEGIRRILARSDSLRDVAAKVSLRLAKEPRCKTITLPPGEGLLCGELFFNCCKRRADRLVLDCEALRGQLGDDFLDWVALLAKACHVERRPVAPALDDLLQRLRFKMPGVDWGAFRSELSAATDPAALLDAFRAAVYLSSLPPPVSPAVLGARLFQDSKRLKNPTVLAWTCRILRQMTSVGSDCTDGDLLERFGLASNPTASTVIVYGPFRYRCRGVDSRWIEELWRRGESAILSCDNLEGLEAVEINTPVLTIENESVFNRMKGEGSNLALVYTAGFPGRAVRAWIGALSSETSLCHWGDGDPEGYEIASILHRIHPLTLYRCAAEDLERMKGRAVPLPDHKRRRGERLAADPSFPFSREIEWILAEDRWLEQEAFYAKEP